MPHEWRIPLKNPEITRPYTVVEWDAIEWIFGRKAFSPRISSTVLLFTVVINGWKSPNLSLIKLTFGRKILPYLWYILGKGQVWAGSFTRHFLVVQSEEEWRHKCGQWESWIRRRWDGVEPFLFILPRHVHVVTKSSTSLHYTSLPIRYIERQHPQNQPSHWLKNVVIFLLIG